MQPGFGCRTLVSDTDSMQRMAMIMLAALLLAILSLRAVADDNLSSREFEIRRQYMHSRVEDFYTRMIEQERAEDARQKTAEGQTKWRNEIELKHEAARKEFVESRKSKVEVDPSQWEAETKARAKIREQERQDFVKRRDIFNREAAKFDTIPEDEEVGIGDNDDDDGSLSSTPPGDQLSPQLNHQTSPDDNSSGTEGQSGDLDN